jgi:hypothetical protein
VELMTEIDLDNQVTSEDEGLSGEKMVPVSEAIRYRRRAQNAEKRASELEQQLGETREQNEHLAEKLKNNELHQELCSKLTSAGVNDLEAAVLLAKSRVEQLEDGGVDAVIDQLRKEKSYLFSKVRSGIVASNQIGKEGWKGRPGKPQRAEAGLTCRNT